MLLSETPEEPAQTPLPSPDREQLKKAGRPLMAVENLYSGAPGAEHPAVRGASFQLHPGTAVSIAGISAAGKSTLARALAGIWAPLAGKVTLGGAALDQYGEEELARHLGWLPQEVVLFQGTVAENISRLDPEPDAGAVIKAARRAGAHEMILSLPGGYDYEVAAGGAALSGGQRQRIALARAFYGDPAVVVLDEPDAHLDAEGVELMMREREAAGLGGQAGDIGARIAAAWSRIAEIELQVLQIAAGGACTQHPAGWCQAGSTCGRGSDPHRPDLERAGCHGTVPSLHTADDPDLRGPGSQSGGGCKRGRPHRSVLV